MLCALCHSAARCASFACAATLYPAWLVPLRCHPSQASTATSPARRQPHTPLHLHPGRVAVQAQQSTECCSCGPGWLGWWVGGLAGSLLGWAGLPTHTHLTPRSPLCARQKLDPCYIPYTTALPVAATPSPSIRFSSSSGSGSCPVHCSFPFSGPFPFIRLRPGLFYDFSRPPTALLLCLSLPAHLLLPRRLHLQYNARIGRRRRCWFCRSRPRAVTRNHARLLTAPTAAIF